MKIELEDKLFKRFELFFPNGRNVDMRQNLMCFGCECGDGWYNLIYEALEKIENIMPEGYRIRMVQVKEKFGSLQIYFDFEMLPLTISPLLSEEESKLLHEKIFNIIDETESKSRKICELCGKKCESRDIGGWVYTLCDECLKNRKRI